MAAALVASLLFLFIGTTVGTTLVDTSTGFVDVDLSTEPEEDTLDYPTELYYEWNSDGPYVWRWNVEEFPHPQLEPRFCQRYAPSNVCDPDMVLKVTEADALDEVIRSIYNDTPCICEKCPSSKAGIQIGIAILKNTFRPYNEMPSKIISSFAKNLRSKWRLGDCEDDILIVVATDDRQSYTDVGKATSKFISQDQAYSIFLEHKAYFSQGRYYDGLKGMLMNYREAKTAITRDHQTSEKVDLAVVVGAVVGALVLFAIVLLLGIWIYRKRVKERQSLRKTSPNTADTISSTWRHKVPLLSTVHVSSETPLKSKIEEEPASEQRQMSEAKTDELKTVTDSPQSSEEEEIKNGERQAEKQADTLVSDNEEIEVMRTFIPVQSPSLHQTDL